MSKPIHVLTLNCWGLKYLATHRHERLKQIGAEIASASPEPSIVALQECWTQQDYESIRAQTKHILPYGKFYFSGIMGGGLAILSKWPIESSNMLRYVLNGRPTAFFRGDWFVGKGVACAKIRLTDGSHQGRYVSVFCTHLHAPYEREPNDSYICHRTAQAWEIARLMSDAYARGHIVLAMGDFNMLPLSLAHKIIETHGRARDVWRINCPESSIGAAVDEVEKQRGKPMPSAEFNLTTNGATCDSVLNTWRWNKPEQKRLARGETILIDPKTNDPRAKRLDYVFLGDALDRTKVSSVRVGMTQRHPKLHCSLSDHFSVEATIEQGSSSFDESANAHRHMGQSGGQIDDTPRYLPAETYDTILGMIHAYVRRQRRQRRLRMGHFFAETGIAIGCLVAVWWSPRNFVSFILTLLSTLGFAAGVLDGLIGGFFVSSELRALKEFEWEIRNAREAALQAEPGAIEGEGEVNETILPGSVSEKGPVDV